MARCNYCTLKRLREKRKGTGIRLLRRPSSLMRGWVAIVEQPGGKEIAHFMELTGVCCC